MKNLLLFSIPTILGILVLQLFISIYSYPNTTIGNLDVSLKTKHQIAGMLKEKENAPISMQIKNRVYIYPSKSIGISVDTNSTINSIFKGHNIFPLNMYYFAKAYFKPTSHLATITFSDEFEKRFKQTIFDFTPRKEEVTFDPSSSEFLYTLYDDKYILDLGSLEFQIKQNFATKNTLTPSLDKIPKPSKKEIIALNNQRLNEATSNPISIVLDQGKNTNIELSQEDLKAVLGATFHPESNSFTVETNESKLSTLLDGKIAATDLSQEKTVNKGKVTQEVSNILNARVLGAATGPIIAETKYKPNTNGERADKYIEIDISQQRMYRFETGNLIAEHLVSTGLYYPTPPGTYKILNKYNNAFSDIYNVWMPYWMAFYLAPDIHAYLGIHELPYWVTGDGTQIRRPRDFLGSPHTGGCVSLDVGVAEIVYAWADVGTPVYIYN